LSKPSFIESDFANSKECWFICSCCGKVIHKEVENIVDVESNICNGCKKYADEIFFGRRIKLVIKNLSVKNRGKFKRMTNWEKKTVIFKLIEKGTII